MMLYSSGNMTITGTFTQLSDERLKRSIRSIPDALEKVSELEGVTYYWKDTAREPTEQIGLIAQAVEKIFPQAVKTDAQGIKSVAYQNLVAPIINAIREVKLWLIKHDSKLALLEIENNKLKEDSEIKDRQIKDLEKRLDKIEKSIK